MRETRREVGASGGASNPIAFLEKGHRRAVEMWRDETLDRSRRGGAAIFFPFFGSSGDSGCGCGSDLRGFARGLLFFIPSNKNTASTALRRRLYEGSLVHFSKKVNQSLGVFFLIFLWNNSFFGINILKKQFLSRTLSSILLWFSNFQPHITERLILVPI